MRFLANENFPAASVQLLRQTGHDVFYAAEDLASLEDENGWQAFVERSGCR